MIFLKSIEFYTKCAIIIFMKYTIENGQILIKSEQDFNPMHILECGQVFRFKKLGENYQVFSLDKTALIVDITDEYSNKAIEKSQNKYYKIITKDVNYFVNYFDLKTNYNNIKKELLSLPNTKQFLSKAIDFGSGIRILNQDCFEAIISFIISQNNNIKRIQQIIEKICEKYGTNMGDYFAFPLPSQLENVKPSELEKLGVGYRANYIVNAVKYFGKMNFDNFKQKNIQEMEKELLNVTGIGQKVCDCIMLFGFHKLNYFPVDTWIEKVYLEYFAKEFKSDDEKLNKKIDRKIMRTRLVQIFGSNSGYAQQYLFYYQRSNS